MHWKVHNSFGRNCLLLDYKNVKTVACQGIMKYNNYNSSQFVTLLTNSLCYNYKEERKQQWNDEAARKDEEMSRFPRRWSYKQNSVRINDLEERGDVCCFWAFRLLRQCWKSSVTCSYYHRTLQVHLSLDALFVVFGWVMDALHIVSKFLVRTLSSWRSSILEPPGLEHWKVAKQAIYRQLWLR